MTQAVLPSVSAWAARRLGGPCSAPLPTTDLAALNEALVPSAFRQGQVAFEAGQRPDGVWIIVQGLVELAVDVGGRHLVAAVVGAGDVFGDVALFGGRGAHCTARALDPATCLLLPDLVLARLITRHPAIARLWLEGLATRFVGSQLRFLHTLAGPLVRRLAQVLLHEERDGAIRLTQATLAGMLGIPRPSVNRALQQLESAKVIDRNYRLIRVIDPARLGRIAKGAEEYAGLDHMEAEST
jgi:CRP/FNR family transcriptional regulator, cAMP and macrophage regulator